MPAGGLHVVDIIVAPGAAPEQRLFDLPKFGAGIGLHRVQAFLGSLAPSAWLDQLDAIKITGSNGKGSAAAIAAESSSSEACGYSLTVSPVAGLTTA